ncbi:MAG: pyridoxal-phosphate-dependent aminotransferase family protein [Candidatus Hodarchaeales archaeon]|jgi:aspartate aminotransferase-like enzyme
MKFPRLYIPGPIDVLPEVLAELSKPPIGHRHTDCLELQEELVSGMRRVLFAEQCEIVLAASSSTGLMEAAIRNCVKSKCLNVVNGAFAKRFADITVANGKKNGILDIPWGKAATPDELETALSSDKYDAVTMVHNETSTGVLQPLYDYASVMRKFDDVIWLVDSVSGALGHKLEVDKLGIDVVVFGVQKAVGLPPGLAIASVSEKAMEKAQTVENRGWYFDFLTWKKYADKNQSPATPVLPLWYGLKKILEVIDQEGLENRFKRHQVMGNLVRDWAKKYFSLFADEQHASNTLTTIKNTKNIDFAEVKKRLLERDYLFATGYGKIKNEVFRIAHMGDRKLDDLKIYLENCEEVMDL